MYLEAALWALSGAALALAPGLALHTVFRQPPLGEPAWLRLYGIQAVGLAMLMVLVAHRIEDLWWWAWAFAFVTVGVTVVTVLNAAFGLGPNEPAALWWLFSLAGLGLSLGLLYGLFVVSRERPLM